MPRPRPPHLEREETRHGVVTWYVRRGHGPRTRITAEYGSEQFWAEYRAALAGAPKPAQTVKTHTLAWGLGRYRESSAWSALSNATRRQSENIYRAVIKTAGDTSLRDITAETIKAGRERRFCGSARREQLLEIAAAFFQVGGRSGRRQTCCRQPLHRGEAAQGEKQGWFPYMDGRGNRTLRKAVGDRYARSGSRSICCYTPGWHAATLCGSEGSTLTTA